MPTLKTNFARKNNIKKSTVFDYSVMWLDEIEKRVKPTTYRKYENALKCHIFPEIGSKKVTALTEKCLNDFTANMTHKNLCANTVNDVLIVLNSILNFAENECGIQLPKAKFVKKEPVKMRVLTLDEQQKLMKYCLDDTDTFKFGVLLALMTGMRIGELCALKWEDIGDDSISINKTMTRIMTENGTEIHIGTAKTYSSNRVIPLPESLKPFTDYFRSDGYVLSNHKLKFTEPRLMSYKFHNMIDACEIDNINFHALRHTFATRCIEAGVDVKTLSELLGHSNVQITLNRYVHSSFTLKQKSIAQLENSLNI